MLSVLPPIGLRIGMPPPRGGLAWRGGFLLDVVFFFLVLIFFVILVGFGGVSPPLAMILGM